jgi:hypothetical protein
MGFVAGVDVGGTFTDLISQRRRRPRLPEERITAEDARRDYGVVVRGDFSVDEEATERLRASVRRTGRSA